MESPSVWPSIDLMYLAHTLDPTLKVAGASGTPTHLRDPCGLCIVLRFEISYFPPRCVAHEEEKQQPYSEAGEMEQCHIFLPIKMNN